MKKAISVLAALIMAASAMATTSYAETIHDYSDAGIIHLQYVLANSCGSDLTINNGTATLESYAVGKASVTKIYAVQTLEKKSGLRWTASAAFSNSSNRNRITLSNTKIGLNSGTYRIKAVFKLTSGDGKTETVTAYSNEITIG